jgi:hypothetical protein
MGKAKNIRVLVLSCEASARTHVSSGRFRLPRTEHPLRIAVGKVEDKEARANPSQMRVIDTRRLASAESRRFPAKLSSLRAKRNSSASLSSGVTSRQGHGAVEPLSLSVKMMQTNSERSKKQRLLNALPEILQWSRTVTERTGIFHRSLYFVSTFQHPGLLPSEGKREYDS